MRKVASDNGQPRLRPGLEVTGSGGNECLRDVASGQELPLSEVDLFLVGALRRGVGRAPALAFQRQFGRPLRTEEWDELLARLRGMGWLEPVSSEGNPLERIRGRGILRETGQRSAQVRQLAQPQPAPSRNDGGEPEEELEDLDPPKRQFGRGRRPRYYWEWGDPNRFLARLGTGQRTWGVLAVLSVLLTGIGAWTVLQHSPLVISDFARLWGRWSLAQHVLFAAISVHLLAAFVGAWACRAHGVPVNSFGLATAMLVVPRLWFDTGASARLDRSARVRVIAAPLFARAALFGIAVMAWYLTRSSGNAFSLLAYTMAFASVIGFFLSINPLGSHEGYQLLGQATGLPNLRSLAFRALFRWPSRNSHNNEIMETYRAALSVYALATLLFTVLLFGVVLYFTARYLEAELSGTGVALFLVLITVLGYSLWKRARAIASKPAWRERQKIARVAREAQETKGGQWRETEANKRPRGPRWWRWGILGALLLLMFLPYPYEAGGSLELLPPQRAQINAEAEGEVTEVTASQGDWVKKDTVIARLAAHVQEKNVQLTADQIREQQASLEQAQVRASFSARELDRFEQMYVDRHVSEQTVEDAREKAESAVKAVDVAKAELERLRSQLRFYEEELERTRLVVPIDGRLITPYLEQKAGMYLKEGELFAEVEDTRTIYAEVRIPESDVGDLETGARVRVKVWTYPNQAFEGRLVSIGTTVTDTTFGRVVAVLTEIPNPDERLKTGMTGHGKISAGTMPVGVAFSRALVRFVLIEMWSWLP
ncbi:MAG: efflux RND transporter periplasmic adaptor subunit [Gammaproteobacteria bacterium]|nr:efflux RND transporter periplasmic adaptor subunit [Gammaproteobacteria bacterium]